MADSSEQELDSHYEHSPTPVLRPASVRDDFPCFDLPSFDCQGLSVTDNSPVGLVSTEGLQRLLNGKDVCMDNRFHGNSVRLCGCVLSASDVLFGGHKTFLPLRQCLNDLQQATADSMDQDAILVLCQQAVQYLVFIECCVHRYLSSDDWLINRQQVAMAITESLSVISDHLGPLEDHLSMLRTSYSNYLAHLVLHTHWSILCILYRLSPLLGPTKLLQTTSSVLRSCLVECALTFDLHSNPFLPCPYVGHLWTLLRVVLDNGHFKFWVVVTDHLLLKRTEFKEPEMFAWWVLSELALLFKARTLGDDRPHPQDDASSWSLITEHLIPRTFSGQLAEFKVHKCLVCAVRLVETWGMCPQLIFRAWEYIHKHINNAPPSGGLLRWDPSHESAGRWLEHLLSLTGGDIDTNWSTFELFLALLSRCLQNPLLWKQFRGRFYSRVHCRWVSELSGCGLARVISIYLILALTVELTETDKMTALLLSLSKDLPFIWKGLLSLVMVHVHLGVCVGGLVDKLVSPLCNLVGRWQSCDNLWDTLSIVLTGTLEAIEMPNAINLGACNLIGPHMSQLLSLVEGPRLTHLLSVIENWGQALSSHPQTPLPCFHSYLEHCILALPSTTLTPPQTLHSIAATGTLLAIQWAGDGGQSSHVQRLYNKFTHDSVHPFVASGYLCHVISNHLMCPVLISTEHAQYGVLRIWLRCMILSHTHPLSCDDHVTELSRLLPKLTFISSLIGSQDPPTNPLTLLKLILSSIRREYSCECVTRVWYDRVRLVLGDLLQTMQPALTGSIQALKVGYSVAAAVVSECPELVYSRTDSRCLLPRLVDCLLLPMATSQTPATHEQASCIRHHLHLFLEGLLSLAGDDFVRRKVRGIISRYLLLYCQPPPLAPTFNPFKALLTQWSGESVSSEKIRQLLFFLDAIRAEYLQLPRQPATLLPVLLFLHELVDGLSCQSVLIKVGLALLPSLLPCLLACETCPPNRQPRGVYKQVMGTVRPLLRSCDSDHAPQFVQCIVQFVCGNISRGGGPVIRTLATILPLAPVLITPSMAHISQALEHVSDQTLRDSLQQLQRKFNARS